MSVIITREVTPEECTCLIYRPATPSTEETQ